VRRFPPALLMRCRCLNGPILMVRSQSVTFIHPTCRVDAFRGSETALATVSGQRQGPAVWWSVEQARTGRECGVLRIDVAQWGSLTCFRLRSALSRLLSLTSSSSLPYRDWIPRMLRRTRPLQHRHIAAALAKQPTQPHPPPCSLPRKNPLRVRPDASSRIPERSTCRRRTGAERGRAKRMSSRRGAQRGVSDHLHRNFASRESGTALRFLAAQPPFPTHLLLRDTLYLLQGIDGRYVRFAVDAAKGSGGGEAEEEVVGIEIVADEAKVRSYAPGDRRRV
jgi:hypothetical protein